MIINLVFMMTVMMVIACSPVIVGYNPRPTYSPIEKQLKYYQVITFSHVFNQPQQISSTWISVNVKAYGQNFVLKLTTDHTIFAPDFDIIHSNGSLFKHDTFNRLRLVNGYVDGDVNSNAYGYLYPNGAFQGHFYYNRTHYYIERADLFFSDVLSHQFIIYTLNDVISHKNVEKLQQDEETTDRTSRSIIDDISDDDIDMLTPNYGGQTAYMDNLKDKMRTKRSKDDSNLPMACSIMMHADHTYTELHRNPLNVAISISVLIQGLNQIYRRADFMRNGRANGVAVLFKRLQINTTEDQFVPNNPLAGTIDTVAGFFLAAISENKTNYCLSFTLSARNFSGGALGIAFQSEAPGVGGVCAGYGSFMNRMLAFNSGIATALYYRHIVPYARGVLILAHEIGHNYGADHDLPDNATCSPSNKNQGKYLMAPRSEWIDLPNNDEFSICTKSYITPHLIQGSSSIGCFTHHSVPVCGNGVIDPGEECDCGYYGHCKDPCCNPPYPRVQNAPYKQANNFLYVPCRRKTTTFCNITNNPCYNNATGLYYTTENQHICNPETPCTHASYCVGNQLSSSCLPALNKPDIITKCYSGYKVCLKGSCTGSLCLHHGLQPCQNSNTSVDCNLYCQDKDKQCLPISNLSLLVNDNRKYILPGSACSNSHGYCDRNGTCHLIRNPSLTVGQSYTEVSTTAGVTAAKFLSQYYWILIVIFVTFCILIAMFFWRKSKTNSASHDYSRGENGSSYTKSVAL